MVGALLAFAVALVGCKKDKVLVERIVLSESDITLPVGDAVELRAEVVPADAMDKLIEWRTSDSEVVIVNTKGKVSAIAEGEAIVTAEAKDESGVKAMCTVRVMPKLDRSNE